MNQSVRPLVVCLVLLGATWEIARVWQKPIASSPPPTAKNAAVLTREADPSREALTGELINRLPAVPSTPHFAEPIAEKFAWDRLLAQPATSERDAALAEALQHLRLTSANAAEQQLLALHPNDRMAIVASTLAQAASRSADEAVREAIRFCDEDPAYALDYGRSLISVLGKKGEYNAALAFVLAEDSNGWLGENGHKWLGSLFTLWATSAPAQAATAALESTAATHRSEALQTVAAVWAKTDPAAAANFAVQLSVPVEREAMLAITLNHWSEIDAASATAWVEYQKNLARSEVNATIRR